MKCNGNDMGRRFDEKTEKCGPARPDQKITIKEFDNREDDNEVRLNGKDMT